MHSTWIRPQTTTGIAAEKLLQQPLSREYRASELLRRPEVSYNTLMSLPDIGPGVTDDSVSEQVEIQAKYSGYVDRQFTEIERQRRHEEALIPEDMDYHKITGLSAEVREKLIRIKPNTVGQASRIPGITPAAISLLLVHLKKRSWQEKEQGKEKKKLLDRSKTYLYIMPPIPLFLGSSVGRASDC